MQTGLVPAAVAAVLIAWAPTQVSKIANPFTDISCALRTGGTCPTAPEGDDRAAADPASSGSDERLMATPLGSNTHTAALIAGLEQLASGP